MTITGVRILPPFAIGRVGSSDRPVENHELTVSPKKPLEFRTVQPAETLVVDKNGMVQATAPTEVKFRDGKRIRPVAPFLEVWVEFDGDGSLRPLNAGMLEPRSDGHSRLRRVFWRVHVANRKVFRRTGDWNDIVEADTGWFSHHHPFPLRGFCDNFVSQRAFVHFGSVQFIDSSVQSHPLALRFTPGKGDIYGPDESDIKHQPYRITETRYAVYRKDASWVGYSEKTGEDGARWYRHGGTTDWRRQTNDTLPTSLYAISATDPPRPSWEREEELADSRGYLDDTCDGFVYVRLALDGGQLLEAKARICAGPPAPVTDSYFVRTLADDLDQVVFGPALPNVGDHAAIRADAEEILRRAFETVRFLNVELMNGNAYKGRDPGDYDTMPELESEEITGRPIRPVFGTGAVDTLAILALHQNVFSALRAGLAPWFLNILRQPHEASDFTDRGRRKMPALMIGADENYLALTYRQIDTIAKAADPSLVRDEQLVPRNRTALGIRDLSGQLRHKAMGNPDNSRPDSAIANCCPGLETDFRAVWRRTFDGIVLREHDNLVIEADSANRDLCGHRLLAIGVDDHKHPMMAEIRVPRIGDPEQDEAVSTPENPHGLHPLEWSNLLARVLYVRRGDGTYERRTSVTCYFTRRKAWHQREPWVDNPIEYIERVFKVRPFFEDDTAVISEHLASPGELTQGLCSPWQNDYRECSCYYWASARPDYVNVEPGPDGLSTGDNWFQKKRTGDYVPDDYVDSQLVLYDDLFAEWEKWVRFQIAGRDAPGEHK